MKTALSYLGQLRPYSLADLVLLLLAAHAGARQLWGSLLLWLAFLALLEWLHRHSYRVRPPAVVWIGLFLAGWYLYGGLVPIAYAACSFLYALKDRGRWGIPAPLLRGIQTGLMVGGITGFSLALPYVAGTLTAIRNLMGDFRDVAKDRKQGMETIPVLLEVRRAMPNIHMAGMLVTSAVWWYLGDLPLCYVLAAWAVTAVSYRLTPR